MADRPGIMFYFDSMADLEDYTPEEVGEIFLAVMRYGMTGEVAQFNDRGMKSVFNSWIRAADRDQAKYDKKIMQTKYARYVRSLKDQGVEDQEIPDMETWLRMYTNVNECIRTLTNVESRTTKSTNYNYNYNSNDQQSTINIHQTARNGKGMQGENPEPSGGYIELLKTRWQDAVANDYTEEAARLRSEIEKLGGTVK